MASNAFFPKNDTQGISGNSVVQDKILAAFYKSDSDDSVLGKSSRAKVILRDAGSFISAVNGATSGEYQTMAGGDLSTIFYPFQLKISGVMPDIDDKSDYKSVGFGVASGSPRMRDILPYRYDSEQSANLWSLAHTPSGDAMADVLSSDKAVSPSRLRDVSDIRGVGLRAPITAVGWGYTREGFPYPDNGASGYPKKFVDDKENGWQVDPSKYVVAPLDLRFDTDKGVWGSDNGHRIIQVLTGESGVYKAKTIKGINREVGISGQLIVEDLGILVDSEDGDCIVWDYSDIDASGLTHGFYLGVDKDSKKEIIGIDRSGEFWGRITETSLGNYEEVVTSGTDWIATGRKGSALNRARGASTPYVVPSGTVVRMYKTRDISPYNARFSELPMSIQSASSGSASGNAGTIINAPSRLMVYGPKIIAPSGTKQDFSLSGTNGSSALLMWNGISVEGEEVTEGEGDNISTLNFGSGFTVGRNPDKPWVSDITVAISGVFGIIAADEKWIHLGVGSGLEEIQHIGPYEGSGYPAIYDQLATLNDTTLSFQSDKRDARGHIFGPDSSGQLDVSFYGDDLWTQTESVPSGITTKHIGPYEGSGYPSSYDLYSSYVGTTITFKTAKHDARGHSFGSSPSGQIQLEFKGDNKWTQATAFSSGIEIDHIGPYVGSGYAAVYDQLTNLDGTSLNFQSNKRDAKGHILGPDSSGQLNVAFHGDNTWIQTVPLSNGIQVNHIGPSSSGLLDLQLASLSTGSLKVYAEQYDTKGHLYDALSSNFVELKWTELDVVTSITSSDINVITDMDLPAPVAAVTGYSSITTDTVMKGITFSDEDLVASNDVAAVASDFIIDMSVSGIQIPVGNPTVTCTSSGTISVIFNTVPLSDLVHFSKATVHYLMPNNIGYAMTPVPAYVNHSVASGVVMTSLGAPSTANVASSYAPTTTAIKAITTIETGKASHIG